jgi:hypothetical protein
MSEANISGKTILLIVPNFHQYTDLIANTFKKMGAKVVRIENKHFFWDYRVKTTFLRNLRKVVFKLTRPDLKYFEEEIKPKIANTENIDYLFCIDCDSLSKPVFDFLGAMHPDAKKILYMWDSLTIYDYADFIRYFDKTFTFDYQDSLEYNINYLPNFVVRDLDNSIHKKKYDLYFIGKQYGNRFQLIKRIYDEATITGLNVFIKLYVQSRRSLVLKYFYKICKHLKFIKSINIFCLNYEIENDIIAYPFITHKKISLNESLAHLKESKCIVDVCFDNQTGVSHRVMQALYYNLKVITNNKLIVNEEFYSPESIKIIDLNAPDFDRKWINTPGIFNHNLMSKYEVETWLSTIFTTII